MCSDNYVGAIGAATLANALQRNTTLHELSLKGNELVNEGTRALCKAFEERQGAISFLDLGNNRYRRTDLCMQYAEIRRWACLLGCCRALAPALSISNLEAGCALVTEESVLDEGNQWSTRAHPASVTKHGDECSAGLGCT